MEHRNLEKISAVLLMAGSGMRFGSHLPKQFHFLSGKKVYLHTLQRLHESNLFHEILVVCSSEWTELVKQETAHLNVSVVEGGATRQESSYRALLACKKGTEFVLIHDGVRPFVNEKILHDNIEALRDHDAVDTCIPCADTIVYAPERNQIQNIPIRAHYLRGQTPQSFSYNLILKAHNAAIQDQYLNASDDCQLVQRLGFPVHIVEGEERNLKITSELDLFLAEQYFRLEQKKWEGKGDLSFLLGKVVAITGGTGGIGSAIAEMLKQHGAVPIVISRTSRPYHADLTEPKQVEDAFRKIHEEYGPLDALINSAGFLSTLDFDLLGLNEIEEMIKVNLLGLICSCKYAVIKPGGHILNISSSSYVRGRKNLSVYSATKAAVVNFTQGLAEERPSLCINVLVPKRTDTRMRHANFKDDPKELLSPETVARSAIEILCSQEITGNIIDVRKEDPSIYSSIIS